MKIQCDVCDKGEASVFCVADEAALCNSCDHRVHHANKLASKHQRFSLLQPSSPKQVPLCDICQERRAFLFCQQDRAILCRECDVPIHKANQHTEKHNRFLLTGVKLSANSALYSSSSSSSSAESAISPNCSDSVSNFKPQNKLNNPISFSANPTNISQNPTQRSNIRNTEITAQLQAATSEKCVINSSQITNGGDNNNNSSTSSIAEYLIEMLPGWHVEDFLDSSSPFGFCKSTNDIDVMPFWDDNLQSNLSPFWPESTSLCVPQAAPNVHFLPTQTQQWFFPTSDMGFGFGGQIGSKELISNTKFSRKRTGHDSSFAVPEISAPSSKRLKTTLW